MEAKRMGITVDWISYTAHYGRGSLAWGKQHASAVRVANSVVPVATAWYDCKPLFGYSAGLESTKYPSLRVYWSVHRPDMGVHVVCPGSTLAQVGWPDWLEMAHQLQAKVTRIDLACDIPEALDIPAMYRSFNDGKCKSSARSAKLVSSSTGDTLYIGSRTSEKFLRVYDKAGEAKLDYPLTRVELECKGDFANGIAKFLYSERDMGKFPSTIRAFCDFPQMAWVDWMTSPTPEISIPKIERFSNTRGWLLEQVAPCLAKESMKDDEFFTEFIRRTFMLMPKSGVGEADLFDGKGDFELY